MWSGCSPTLRPCSASPARSSWRPIPNATDPDFVELVEELSVHSTRFRDLWAWHDVVAGDAELATLHHPVVGELRMHS